MATQEIDMPAPAPPAPAAVDAAPNAPESLEEPERERASPAVGGLRNAPPRRAGIGLAAFLPAVAAAVALAVHWCVPNRQTAEPTHLYPRFLEGVIVFGVLLGITQRLWR